MLNCKVNFQNLIENYNGNKKKKMARTNKHIHIISKEEIETIYGSPMEVMRDLVKACELLDLGISSNKYDDINEMAVHMIGSYENH